MDASGLHFVRSKQFHVTSSSDTGIYFAITHFQLVLVGETNLINYLVYFSQEGTVFVNLLQATKNC